APGSSPARRNCAAMYSAAISRPRDGVLRPSSRSDAMKERWPRSESSEMRSSAAWISRRTAGAFLRSCALPWRLPGCGAACLRCCDNPCGARQATTIAMIKKLRVMIFKRDTASFRELTSSALKRLTKQLGNLSLCALRGADKRHRADELPILEKMLALGNLRVFTFTIHRENLLNINCRSQANNCGA